MEYDKAWVNESAEINQAWFSREAQDARLRAMHPSMRAALQSSVDSAAAEIDRRILHRLIASWRAMKPRPHKMRHPRLRRLRR